MWRKAKNRNNIIQSKGPQKKYPDLKKHLNYISTLTTLNKKIPAKIEHILIYIQSLQSPSVNKK